MKRFITVLMSAMIALSMMPALAFAADDPVPQDLPTSGELSGEYSLTDDTELTGPITVPEGETVTITGDDKAKLVISGTNIIEVKGNIVLKDVIVDANNTPGWGAICVTGNSASLTINSSSITQNCKPTGTKYTKSSQIIQIADVAGPTGNSGLEGININVCGSMLNATHNGTGVRGVCFCDSTSGVLTVDNSKIYCNSGDFKASYTRGISTQQHNKNRELQINIKNKSEIKGYAYPILNAGDVSSEGHIVLNAIDSTFSGWCCAELLGYYNILNYTNCDINGLNMFSDGASNDYSLFQTSYASGNDPYYSSGGNNVITLSNCSLTTATKDDTTAKQKIANFEDGTSVINFRDGTEIVQQDNRAALFSAWDEDGADERNSKQFTFDDTVNISGGNCCFEFNDAHFENVITSESPDVKVYQGNTGVFTLAPTLKSAISNATEGDTISLNEDVVLSEKVTIDKAIVINGNGKTISAADGFANDHLLLLTSGATIKNITLDSNKKAKGVQVYSDNTSVEASFDNVNFKNSTGSGLTVNGTTVNLKDALFDGNAWQDVNVDSGVGVTNDSVLNIGTGCAFNNQYQISSDGQKVDGKYTDRYGKVNLNDSSKVLDVNNVEVGEGESKYTKRFWTVSDKPAPVPTPEPEDPITNTGSGDNTSTNVDASDNTTTSDSGKTETTIDSNLGDKIVENAKENSVADVVIKAETEKGDSTGSTVALPESTVQALAKDTEASVTIKTDSAEVKLDKAAVDAVAAQAGTDGEVKLVVETVENTVDTLKVELKLVTSKGTVIDFQGGNVTVTVPVSDELASKKLVCVYIDDNGKYIKMDGSLASDGKTFTFTTGHFSTYAILSEEEANAAIDGQNISKATVSGLANKTYTGKAITQKLTVKAGDKALVEGTDYTVSYSKNVNVGVASVKITGTGKYEGTLTKTFKINPKGTSISKVTGQKKAVKVVWKKQLTKMKTSYVSGYQVQYSTSSKFTSGTSKYANAKFSKGRTTKTIKNLKSGKKYYVRVRTYKSVDGTKCYSSWSKVKSVKTK